MDKLKEQDIVNEITVKDLQDTDIQDLGLNIGQRAPQIQIDSLGYDYPTSGTEHGSSSIRFIFYMY